MNKRTLKNVGGMLALSLGLVFASPAVILAAGEGAKPTPGSAAKPAASPAKKPVTAKPHKKSDKPAKEEPKTTK